MGPDGSLDHLPHNTTNSHIQPHLHNIQPLAVTTLDNKLGSRYNRHRTRITEGILCTNHQRVLLHQRGNRNLASTTLERVSSQCKSRSTIRYRAQAFPNGSNASSLFPFLHFDILVPRSSWHLSLLHNLPATALFFFLLLFSTTTLDKAVTVQSAKRTEG